MNTIIKLAQTFRHTTVNPVQVEDFLLGLPGYRQAGYQLNVSPYAGCLLHRADTFGFELRQYLAGESKTHYHLNRQVRTFIALDDHSARAMIHFSLNAVEVTLLDNEWYELMPRYRKVRQHIHKLLDGACI